MKIVRLKHNGETLEPNFLELTFKILVKKTINDWIAHGVPIMHHLHQYNEERAWPTLAHVYITQIHGKKRSPGDQKGSNNDCQSLGSFQLFTQEKTFWLTINCHVDLSSLVPCLSEYIKIHYQDNERGNDKVVYEQQKGIPIPRPKCLAQGRRYGGINPNSNNGNYGPKMSHKSVVPQGVYNAVIAINTYECQVPNGRDSTEYVHPSPYALCSLINNSA